MTRWQHNRARLEVSARAALAADRWLLEQNRREDLAELSDWQSGEQDRDLAERLMNIRRIARRLPNEIGRYLDVFIAHPELAPWLQSREDLFKLCRMSGAVLFGSSLARMVDQHDVNTLVTDLGEDVWEVGIENRIEEFLVCADPAYLTDALLSAGARSVHAHLRDTLPELVDPIAHAAGLDWTLVDDGGSPEAEAEALRRVFAQARTP
jgi:hypothetical protein